MVMENYDLIHYDCMEKLLADINPNKKGVKIIRKSDDGTVIYFSGIYRQAHV